MLLLHHRAHRRQAGKEARRRFVAQIIAEHGRVIADLCNHLNPEMIVIGGDMRVAPSFLRGIRDSIDRYAQPDTARALTVVPGTLGDRAGVVGALVVARDDTAVVGEPTTA